MHMSAGGRGSRLTTRHNRLTGGGAKDGGETRRPVRWAALWCFFCWRGRDSGRRDPPGLPALTARPRRAVWWRCRRRPPAAPCPSATLTRYPLVRERGFVVPSRPRAPCHQWGAGATSTHGQRRPPPPPLPAPARPPAIGGGGGARGARGTAAVAAAKRVWRPLQTITTAKVGAAVQPWRASSIGCAAGAGPPTLAGRPTGGCASLTRPPPNTRAIRATSCGRLSTGG